MREDVMEKVDKKISEYGKKYEDKEKVLEKYDEQEDEKKARSYDSKTRMSGSLSYVLHEVFARFMDFFPYILAILIVIFEGVAIIGPGQGSFLEAIFFSIIFIAIFFAIDSRDIKGTSIGFNTKRKSILDNFTMIISVLSAGLLSGFGYTILKVGFGLPLQSWYGFLFFLLYLAIFSTIYSSTGLGGILSISFIIVIVGYLLAGPYGGVVRPYVDGMKEPVYTAYYTVKDGVSNIWLMMTDPMGWYHKQQMENVKPEDSINYPMGVEITTLEATPKSVPEDGSIPFRINAVVKNKGDMPAKDVQLKATCEEYCIVGESISGDQEDNETIIQRYDKETLVPGASYPFSLGDFIPNEDASPYTTAEIEVASEYRYSTNSSLSVSIYSQEEINKMFTDGNNFQTVPAFGKPSPAMLSLNVGPQPLISGRENMGVLVSVLNTRNSGYIYLDGETRIKLTVPEDISNSFTCNSKYLKQINNEGTTKEFKINTGILQGQQVKIDPKRRDTIFAFYCGFDVNEVEQRTKTSLITAELIDYKYAAVDDVDVKITYPLGIVQQNETNEKEPNTEEPEDYDYENTEEYCIVDCFNDNECEQDPNCDCVSSSECMDFREENYWKCDYNTKGHYNCYKEEPEPVETIDPETLDDPNDCILDCKDTDPCKDDSNCICVSDLSKCSDFIDENCYSYQYSYSGYFNCNLSKVV